MPDNREALLNIRLRVAEQAAKLTTIEEQWRARQPFLATQGYMLRPRFRPDWVPSWRGQETRIYIEDREDSLAHDIVDAIDAIRMEDSCPVFIKLVRVDSDEYRIWKALDALREDPGNHTVPILDCIVDDRDANLVYMVMPLLRFMDDPPFEYVENIVDFLDQILEGLTFMHEHGFAHRDCSRNNLMVDASTLYPFGFHPKMTSRVPDNSHSAYQVSRMEGVVKYYYIDFGLSVHIPPTVHPKRSSGRLGRDRDAPELASEAPYDPFKLDVFIIGNVIKNQLYERYANVQFLRPMVETMTRLDPDARPSAGEAYRRWMATRRGLSPLQRICRLRGVNEGWPETAIRDIFSFIHITMWISRRVYAFVVRAALTIRRRALRF